MSDPYHVLLEEKDFPADGIFTSTVNGWRVFVAKSEGAYFAVNDRCSHAASILSAGRIRRGHVMCPMHGARFDLATGKCAGGAYQPIRTFPLRVIEGRIEVALPADPPSMADMPVAFE